MPVVFSKIVFLQGRMGPEIFFAFLAFLGVVFWFIVRGLLRLFIFVLNIIYIPYALLNNYIRVKFWGLEKKATSLGDFKKPFW